MDAETVVIDFSYLDSKLRMKPLFLIVALIGTSFHCFGQETITPEKDYEYYRKKQRSNMTAATILMVGGAVIACTGVAIDLGNMFEPDKADDKTGGVLFYTGVAAMAGSIPLFIGAGTNRRRAISIKNQPTATLHPLKFRSTPSLTLTFSF